MSKRKYANLDAIRGIAAILIFFRHAPALFTSPEFRQSYLAVDLFFAMSGFVVANAYEERLLSGSLSFVSFLKLRLIRLFPLYLLGTLIGIFEHFALEPSSNHEGLRSAVSTASFALLPLLMLPSRAKPLYPVNNPAWSLLYEIVANSLYARAIKNVSFAILVIVISCSAVVISVYSVIHRGMDTGWNLSAWYVALGRVAFSFSVGVLLHRVKMSIPRESASLSAITLAGATLLLCIDVPANWAGVAAAAEIVMAVPLVVYMATSFEPPPFIAPAFEQLGRVSYGLYIIHVPVLLTISKLPMNEGRIYGSFALAIFLAAILISVAILDRYFDQPARRALSNLFKRTEKSTMRTGFSSGS
jgi:peptidoglycan/LPS O-acetylase OafA/YrhL